MVRTDCSQLVMFDTAEIESANSVIKIDCSNLTGLLSPDLLCVCVSNVPARRIFEHLIRFV